MRLTPLGPMPRSDTPCAVGCDARLLVRRNRLNVGTCRSTSSATTAGDWRMSSRPITLTLAGTSPRRCSIRDAVTVTVSDSDAGVSTTSTRRLVAPGASVRRDSANDWRRTTSTTSPGAATASVKRPSAPETVCRSLPLTKRAMTVAPATTWPDESRTDPGDCRGARDGTARSRRRASRSAQRVISCSARRRYARPTHPTGCRRRNLLLDLARSRCRRSRRRHDAAVGGVELAAVGAERDAPGTACRRPRCPRQLAARRRR